MGGDGQFFLPPCNDGPPNPLKANEAAADTKLVHDCYEQSTLQKITIPPLPDLRSTGEKIMDGLGSLLIPKSELQSINKQADADLAKENIDPKASEQIEAAFKKVQTKAWDNFLSRRDIFPTTDKARDAYITLMRGYNETTLKAGTLTAEQLHYVNNFGLNNSAGDGIHQFKWGYTVQHN